MKKIDRVIQESINNFLIKEGFSFRERTTVDVSHWYNIGIIDYWPYAGKGYIEIWSNPEDPTDYVLLRNNSQGKGLNIGNKYNIPAYDEETGNKIDLSIDSEFKLQATLYDKDDNSIYQKEDGTVLLLVTDGRGASGTGCM